MVSEGNDRQDRPKTRKNLPRRDLGVPAKLEANEVRRSMWFFSILI